MAEDHRRSAQSWTTAPDGLTYTFKLNPDVHFHDGSVLTSADVKASFERQRNPPEGVAMPRKPTFSDIASIETPDPLTIVFKLSQPNAAFLNVLASPWNCIYSAKKLAEDPKFPATNVMGSGPFVFVDYIKGAQWTSKRFDNYFRKGLPYLDGIKAIPLQGAGVVNAVAGGQVDAETRFVSPPERDRIKAQRGDKITFQSVIMNVFVFATINTQHKPLDDLRVRQALNLAIDRVDGEAALSKITALKGFGGVMRPSSEFALTQDEALKLPGIGGDIKANRERARKLLAEAGASDLKFKLVNRNIVQPYQFIGIFLIEQWRQIGVQVEMIQADNAAFFGALTSGDFDVAVDFNSSVSDDPTEVLGKFLPNSPTNYSYNKNDHVLPDLYAKQKVALDPVERKELVHAFETHLFETLPILPLFWNDRVVALGSDVKGWTVTPSLHAGYDFATVWLDR